MHTPQVWHNLSFEDTLRSLDSDCKVGLSFEEVTKRLSQFGPNSLPEPKTRSLFSLFFHQFLSPLIYLLLIAAFIAILIDEAKDAYVILVVVFLNAVIGTFQEGRAEQSLAALRKMTKIKSRVLRNGQEFLIEASEIVPGDILILAAGDAVSADAKLLEVNSLAAAEAALTGESVPVVKSIHTKPAETLLADRSNMVYAGTFITAGRGIALVVATGLSTELGKIAELAQGTVQPKTQLEIRIAQFGRALVIAALAVFVFVVLLGFLREIPFSQIFMIAISQMVSLVPEGLPVALTIALAVGVQRMAKKKTIVRKLSAVETLGSTTVICTDKTGTLTRNEMTVTDIYLPDGNRNITLTGVGYAPEGQFYENKKSFHITEDLTLQKLLEVSSLCNDAQLVHPDAEDSRWRILGDPTEGALLTMAIKGGLDLVQLKKKFPRKAELPFDSNVKMMATQHDFEGKNIVYLKGAPESILNMCTAYFAQGSTQKMDSSSIEKIHFSAKRMADSALRVLAVGFIENAHIDGEKGFSAFQDQVVLLGLVGELDPPREEVAESVQSCWNAGVRPVMVTGDHKATALAIAKSLGMSREGDLAFDGLELEKMSDQELIAQIHRISVFARVHPAQKLRIVETLQKSGEIVAMTGDGVNDGPALVKANVGVAMGITGTEVAKEAAKIVITDDRFTTIVSAISEGRLVYQNIKKLLLFLFVTSIDEVIVLFLALLLGYPLPLAAVQILWINLVTEGALTINLIMEPEEGNEMRRPPVPKDQPLLDRSLLSRIPLMVIASVISTFGWYVYRFSQGIPLPQVQTETFTVLAVCQWFNVLNCRSATRSIFTWDLLKNPWLVGGLILGNALHLMVIYWEPLGRFFHTVPIAAGQFIAIGVVASLVLWVEEGRKFFTRVM